MSVDDQNQKKPADIFTSPVDPDYECIPIEGQTPNGKIAAPPPGGVAPGGQALCPEGYVPRRKKRSQYSLRGKTIVDSGKTPERNPTPREPNEGT